MIIGLLGYRHYYDESPTLIAWVHHIRLRAADEIALHHGGGTTSLLRRKRAQKIYSWAFERHQSMIYQLVDQSHEEQRCAPPAVSRVV